MIVSAEGIGWPSGVVVRMKTVFGNPSEMPPWSEASGNDSEGRGETLRLSWAGDYSEIDSEIDYGACLVTSGAGGRTSTSNFVLLRSHALALKFAGILPECA